MARRPYTRELYDRLTDSYRTFPGEHYRVAAEVNLGWRACKLAYEEGWKGRHVPWAMPIRERLAAESEADALANAKRVAKAKTDAAERRRLLAEAKAMRIEALEQVQLEYAERENKIVQAVAGDALAGAMVVRNMVPIVTKLLTKLDAAVQNQNLSVNEMTKLVGMFFHATNRVAYAGDRVVQLSRLLRGATTANIGFMRGDMPDDEQAGANEAETVSLAEESTAHHQIVQRYLAKRDRGEPEVEGEPAPFSVRQPTITTTGERVDE